MNRLTRRELEVLALMAEGLTYPQICRRLWISQGTIRTHAWKILSKLGCNCRAQAVAVFLSQQKVA